jgi:hypothetical protein
MLTLSIQQPWAWAIINLGKDIENRGWKYPPKYRGEFLIHAGKKIDYYGIDFLNSKFENIPEMFDIGGIVGKSKLIGVVTESSSMWFFGPLGLVLAESVSLPFMPCLGQLGFFDVNYKV